MVYLSCAGVQVEKTGQIVNRCKYAGNLNSHQPFLTLTNKFTQVVNDSHTTLSFFSRSCGPETKMYNCKMWYNLQLKLDHRHHV